MELNDLIISMFDKEFYINFSVSFSLIFLIWQLSYC